MFFKRKNIFGYLSCALLLLALLTRFYKLDWGDGYFFHPDEMNMAVAITRFSTHNLDPHFYAYGQFPLYLTYFSIKTFNFISNASFTSPVSLESAVFGLRIWSALFSLASLLLLYRLSRLLFPDKVSPRIFVLLLIFTPGLIQLSHFGTTESFLFFVFCFNLLIAVKIFEKFKLTSLVLAAFISGIAVGTKISAIIMFGPVLLSLLLTTVKTKKIAYYILRNLIFFLVVLLTFSLSSPYNLVNFNDYKSALSYETAVALGHMKVFYTNQFLDTKPYLFQLQKVFPYTQGIFIFLLSAPGLVLLIKKMNHKWLLILLPSFVYFLYNGQLYVKWTRFMSPLFFLPPLLATYFFSHLRSKTLIVSLIAISIIPGVFFWTSRFETDVRLKASDWFIDNIPANTKILSESGNVINIPLASVPYDVNNFDFYVLENNPLQLELLSKELRLSEYIIVPSRRVFKNQQGDRFPTSRKYYEALFSGDLGFVEIKKFERNNSFLLNSEDAEETWSVFDNPTIRVFKKFNHLSLEEYKKILGAT
ncbi:MAG: glycosyltransferase family 39 protein [Patescibacteria group bacterium]|jgi:4-amino-4-deoxy-L-arabinose transferase-like glycosyltransferase